MLLCEEWNVFEGKGVSAEIAFSSSTTNKLFGSCEEMAILEEDLSRSIEDANDELEAKRPYIVTHPEVNLF